jgi:hypothetical protein
VCNLNQIDIFLSHSSADAKVAKALIDLLRDAFQIENNKIRCTSLPGYKLPAGAHTESELRREVQQVRIFIGLLSEISLDSAYVLFELGARWGSTQDYGGYNGSSTKNRIFPLLAAGASGSILREPLKGYNALNVENAGDLHQLIEEIGVELGQKPGSAAAYQDKLQALISASRQLKAKRTKEQKAKEAKAMSMEAVPKELPVPKPARKRVSKPVVGRAKKAERK